MVHLVFWTDGVSRARGNVRSRIIDQLRHRPHRQVVPKAVDTVIGPVRVIDPAAPRVVVRLTRVEN